MLFKACVDLFDLMQGTLLLHQEADYSRLVLKSNIEKCKLYTWSQMMELTSMLQNDESQPLDSFHLRDLVIQSLKTLYELFNDFH